MEPASLETRWQLTYSLEGKLTPPESNFKKWSEEEEE